MADRSKDGRRGRRVCALVVAMAAAWHAAANAGRSSGDVNGDGVVNVADAVYLLAHLFAGGPGPVECLRCDGGEDLPAPWTAARYRVLNSGDVNADWRLNIADPIHLLRHLFADGTAPERCGVCWPCGPRRLPATGLRDCCWGYGASQVPCDDPEWSGQDAQLQLGCPQEGRFVDNGDGTVSDLCTGLMWQKETAHPVPGGYYLPVESWEEALAYAEGLELAGWDDWRLPNIVERLSLVRLPCEVLSLPDAANDFLPEIFRPYPKGPSGHSYHNWTSTRGAAAYYHLFGGDSSLVRNGGFVRCVRGGLDRCEAVLPATGVDFCFDPQDRTRIPCDSPEAIGQDGYYQAGCPMDGRFIDNGDGTITDLCTGLMWEKEVEGHGLYHETLAYARNLDLGGYTDWRVPNYFEFVYVLDWWSREQEPLTRLNSPVYPFVALPGRRSFFVSSVAHRGPNSSIPEGDNGGDRVQVGLYNGRPPTHVTGDFAPPDAQSWVRCVRGPIWLAE